MNKSKIISLLLTVGMAASCAIPSTALSLNSMPSNNSTNVFDDTASVIDGESSVKSNVVEQTTLITDSSSIEDKTPDTSLSGANTSTIESSGLAGDDEIMSVLQNTSGLMNKAALDGTNMSYSDALGSSLGISIPQTPLIDTSNLNISSTIDAGDLNFAYANAATALQMIQSSNLSTALSGRSGIATEEFSKQYGGIASSLTLEDASIPADFEASVMAQKTNNTLQDVYSQAVNSDSFMAVKNSISTADIFDSAKQGAKVYEKIPTSTLAKGLTDLSSVNASKSQAEYKSALSNVNNQKRATSTLAADAQVALSNCTTAGYLLSLNGVSQGDSGANAAYKLLYGESGNLISSKKKNAKAKYEDNYAIDTDEWAKDKTVAQKAVGLPKKAADSISDSISDSAKQDIFNAQSQIKFPH